LNGLPYTESVDIWSYGVLLYRLLVFDSPFPPVDAESGDREFASAVGAGDWNRGLLLSLGVPESCCELINGCLQSDPSLRISASEALESRFFSEFQRVNRN
jgi:serine/threonine protein kinase